MTTRTSTNFWLDVISLVVMVGLAGTGGLIHFVLPAGSGHFYELFGWNRHDIGQVHFYLATAAVGLLALHVLLHWSWVCCVVGKAVGRGTPSRRAQTTWGLVLLLGIAIFLIGGLWGASIMVQKTAPEGGGRGRGAQLEDSQDLRTHPRRARRQAQAASEHRARGASRAGQAPL